MPIWFQFERFVWSGWTELRMVGRESTTCSTSARMQNKQEMDTRLSLCACSIRSLHHPARIISSSVCHVVRRIDPRIDRVVRAPPMMQWSYIWYAHVSAKNICAIVCNNVGKAQIWPIFGPTITLLGDHFSAGCICRQTAMIKVPL
jgi:hypothetical protein